MRPAPDAPKTIAQLAEYIRLLSLHRCSVCDRPFTGRGRPTLRLRFIDGDPTNWQRRNLQVLCKRCYRRLVGDDKRDLRETYRQGHLRL